MSQTIVRNWYNHWRIQNMMTNNKWNRLNRLNICDDVLWAFTRALDALGLARRIWVSPVGAEFRKAVRHRGVVPVVTVWAR